MTGTDLACKICGNDKDLITFKAREVLFDTWEEFDYFECPKCGCVQIVDIPEDLGKYYPEDYLPLHKIPPKKNNALMELMRQMRAKYKMGMFSPVGKLVSKFRPDPYFWSWMEKIDINFDSKILDIGCAYGQLLRDLKHEGFRNLSGVDLFIEDDAVVEDTIKIYKQDFLEFDGKYDMVMMHHVLEHLPLQEESIQKAADLLAPGGKFICRIPSVSSYIWKHYRLDALLLDPPRHLFLHTDESMRVLVEKAGMKIDEITYISSVYELMATWASEQIKQKIAFMSEKSYQLNPEKSIFSEEDIQKMAAEAEERVKQGEGSEPVYIISKA